MDEGREDSFTAPWHAWPRWMRWSMALLVAFYVASYLDALYYGAPR
jgi:hypothetical protein